MTSEFGDTHHLRKHLVRVVEPNTCTFDTLVHFGEQKLEIRKYYLYNSLFYIKCILQGVQCAFLDIAAVDAYGFVDILRCACPWLPWAKSYIV